MKGPSVDKINTPFVYEPSGDCDGERYGIDHFVLDSEGNELACAPNESVGRLLAASPDLLEACQRFIRRHNIACESSWFFTEVRSVIEAAVAKATGETKP